MRVKIFTIITLAAALFLAACGKSDADLQKAANDKLAADKIAGVTAAVKDGAATLTGEVADITLKSKAEASVKTVDGIKSVDTSKITLKALPPPPEPAGDDKMMEGTITENLKKANVTSVNVAVSGGAVTLTGSVTDTKELAKAMQAASSANPKHIDNKIEVKK